MPYPEFMNTISYITSDDKDKNDKFIYGTPKQEDLEAELERFKERQRRFKQRIKKGKR